MVIGGVGDGSPEVVTDFLHTPYSSHRPISQHFHSAPTSSGQMDRNALAKGGTMH